MKSTPSSDTVLYNSDTEIYAQTDYNRDTPTRSRVKVNKAKKKTKKCKTNYRITNTSNTSQNRISRLFKCPVKLCGIRKPTRKDITRHYKLKHNILNVCNICNREYTMPHSLQQHKYFHMKRIRNFTCVRCNSSFPFLSQLKIHRLKHMRKLRHECTECSEPFKYRHDMLKHRREHTAALLGCKQCDYRGTKLKLVAHSKQHDPATYKRCTLCNMLFVHRMSYWRHKQTCKPKLSNSPVY